MMVLDEKKTYETMLEKSDDARKMVMEAYGYKLFPNRNGPHFSDDGQPQYEQFCDPRWPRYFLSNDEVVACHKADCFKMPANHLYAEGPMQLIQGDTLGINSLPAFINATQQDNTELMNNLQVTLNNIFTEELLQKTGLLDYDKAHNDSWVLSMKTFKFFALMGHFAKTMCQQHFKVRFGAIVDSFLPLTSSRRLLSLSEDSRVPQRSEMWMLLTKEMNGNDEAYTDGILAATKENEQIDTA